jgi:long-chain acyl-CoA synthetase
MAIETLCDIFLATAGHGKSDCLLHKVDGKWLPVSTDEFVDGIRRLATVLDELGVKRGDRVAIMADNGVHWSTVDFACLCVGAVVVPIYPTLTSDQGAYVANDCGAEILFIQERDRLEGMMGESDDMPAVREFIMIGDDAPEGVSTLSGLMGAAEPMPREELESRANQAQPDDLATFIYTSGTTGNPKGVMLTHRNIASNVMASESCLEIGPTQTALSFLPLSHSFERTIDYIYFYKGTTVAYAESVQLVAQNFGEVKPHVFVSVPRVYEKVLGKVHENVAKSSGLKQKIFHWAEGVARDALPYRLKGETPPGLLGVKLGLADKLVFGKIKDRLGGRFQFAASGGAPLSRDVAEFFWGAGIEIYEGYGLTETSPVLTINNMHAAKMGTVGTAIEDVEILIAEDGEILAKGPNIMRGYHNLPDATAESIDDEGWFHTGDIGELDSEGYLRITDRKKELIVNAYGKNIAPAPIENALKSSRFIEQAMVIGDKRKFLSALLVPDFETLKAWGASKGLGDDPAALAGNPEVRSLYETEIVAVNKKLAKYEQVHAFDLLEAEWTIETGELTPTQKIKRRVINKKYGDRIDAVYERAEAERG